MPLTIHERSVFEFALKHLEVERARLDGMIADVQRQLGTKASAAGSTPTPEATTKKPAKKRGMSAEGKARLIAALKKRWAAYHKTQAKGDVAPEPVTKKAAAKAAGKK